MSLTAKASAGELAAFLDSVNPEDLSAVVELRERELEARKRAAAADGQVPTPIVATVEE